MRYAKKNICQLRVFDLGTGAIVIYIYVFMYTYVCMYMYVCICIHMNTLWIHHEYT